MSQLMQTKAPRYSWRRLWLPLVLLVAAILGTLAVGDYPSPKLAKALGVRGNHTIRVLGAREKNAVPKGVGVVDLKVLEQVHPNFMQLEALEEQMAIYQEQWYDHVQLVARQASLDGQSSPFLTEMNQAINPVASMESRDMENLWEDAKKERAEYHTKLQQEMEADLEKEQVNLEKNLAKQVEKLEKQTKQAILHRQLELALRKLTPQEAEALLDEISSIEAEFQDKKERLEADANRQLQAKADQADKAATEKLHLYDEELRVRLIAQLDKLQSDTSTSTEPGGLAVSAAGGRSVDSYLEAFWQQQLASRHFLDTSSIDPLEAKLWQEKAHMEAKMEPLRARYRLVQGEMEEDLQSYIAEVARSMGLVLVVDKNQVEVRGIDITNQVLVILQGEA